MKRHIIWTVFALFLATASQAQDAQTDVVRQAMFDAANELVATLQSGRPGMTSTGVDRAKSLLFELDSPERENWQFWPTVRVGLTLEDMTGTQRRLTHDLLRSVLSSKGYLKAVHIMQLEQILDMIEESGPPRSVDHYRLVVFGTPSMADDWAWRFEGHHVSLSTSVSPNGISVTPSFFGSNPAEVASGPLVGFRVHGVLEDLARELVNSLSASHQAQAIVADRPPADLFSANIRKERAEWDLWRETLEPQGVPIAELNEVQQFWVRRMLDEIVGNYRPELSVAYLDDIDITDLHFAWMGETQRRTPHYFRLQGTDFVFEYDNVQNNGNHVHSVWRNKSEDFGADILEQHYRTSHLR
jgi:hypothetical protein